MPAFSLTGRIAVERGGSFWHWRNRRAMMSPTQYGAVVTPALTETRVERVAVVAGELEIWYFMRLSRCFIYSK
jgi:hypothetical protein